MPPGIKRPHAAKTRAMEEDPTDNLDLLHLQIYDYFVWLTEQRSSAYLGKLRGRRRGESILEAFEMEFPELFLKKKRTVDIKQPPFVLLAVQHFSRNWNATWRRKYGATFETELKKEAEKDESQAAPQTNQHDTGSAPVAEGTIVMEPPSASETQQLLLPPQVLEPPSVADAEAPTVVDLAAEAATVVGPAVADAAPLQTPPIAAPKKDNQWKTFYRKAKQFRQDNPDKFYFPRGQDPALFQWLADQNHRIRSDPHQYLPKRKRLLANLQLENLVDLLHPGETIQPTADSKSKKQKMGEPMVAQNAIAQMDMEIDATTPATTTPTKKAREPSSFPGQKKGKKENRISNNGGAAKSSKPTSNSAAARLAERKPAPKAANASSTKKKISNLSAANQKERPKKKAHAVKAGLSAAAASPPGKTKHSPILMKKKKTLVAAASPLKPPARTSSVGSAGAKPTTGVWVKKLMEVKEFEMRCPNATKLNEKAHPDLFRWLAKNKSALRDFPDKMGPKRKAALESLRVWENHPTLEQYEKGIKFHHTSREREDRKSWDERYVELLEYCSQHPDRDYIDIKEYPSLLKWFQAQLWKIKNHPDEYDPNQMEALVSMGLRRSGTAEGRKSFDEHYQELLDYCKEHPDRDYLEGVSPSLYKWFRDQHRLMRKSEDYDPERRAKLEKLKLKLPVATRRSSDMGEADDTDSDANNALFGKWKDRYQELLDYLSRLEPGAPKTVAWQNNVKLYSWLMNQKYRMRNHESDYDPVKRQALESLGLTNLQDYKPAAERKTALNPGTVDGDSAATEDQYSTNAVQQNAPPSLSLEQQTALAAEQATLRQTAQSNGISPLPCSNPNSGVTAVAAAAAATRASSGEASSGTTTATDPYQSMIVGFLRLQEQQQLATAAQQQLQNLLNSTQQGQNQFSTPNFPQGTNVAAVLAAMGNNGVCGAPGGGDNAKDTSADKSSKPESSVTSQTKPAVQFPFAGYQPTLEQQQQQQLQVLLQQQWQRQVYEQQWYQHQQRMNPSGPWENWPTNGSFNGSFHYPNQQNPPPA